MGVFYGSRFPWPSSFSVIKVVETSCIFVKSYCSRGKIKRINPTIPSWMLLLLLLLLLLPPFLEGTIFNHKMSLQLRRQLERSGNDSKKIKEDCVSLSGPVMHELGFSSPPPAFFSRGFN